MGWEPSTKLLKMITGGITKTRKECMKCMIQRLERSRRIWSTNGKIVSFCSKTSKMSRIPPQGNWEPTKLRKTIRHLLRKLGWPKTINMSKQQVKKICPKTIQIVSFFCEQKIVLNDKSMKSGKTGGKGQGCSKNKSPIKESGNMLSGSTLANLDQAINKFEVKLSNLRERLEF